MSATRTLPLAFWTPSTIVLRRLGAWCLVALFFGLLLAALLIDPGMVAQGGAGQVMQALGTDRTL